MDWSKAKNVLIVAFLIINLILGYIVHINRQEDPFEPDEALIEESLRLLAEKNITVEGGLAKEIQGVPPLILEYESLDIDSLNKDFFDGQASLSLGEKGKKFLTARKEELIVNTNHKLIYRKEEGQGDRRSLSLYNKEDLVDISKDFLATRGFPTNDMSLTYFEKTRDKYILVYTKIYKGILVEDSYTKFTINNKGLVEKMDRLWLNVIEVGEEPIYIDSAAKSILELLSMEEAYGQRVVDISLSYFLDSNKGNEGDLEIKSARAMPAWRVQLSDGRKIIINKF